MMHDIETNSECLMMSTTNTCNTILDYLKEYVGLKNQGATSYLNVELQLLYSIKYFCKAIYQIPTEDDDPNKSIPLAMQSIFYQLEESNTPVETTELTRTLGWNAIDSFIPHDAQEFNRLLLGNLEYKMKDAISKLFIGKMKSYVKCVNVNYESSRIEDYYDIQLNVKGCKTLNDSFLEYIREESCEGNNKYKTETYGLQNAKKGVIFESFPPVLRIQLKRFEYDMQKDATVKINDCLEYPMEIDLHNYLSSDSNESKPHNYLLHGVIVHSGDLHEGSYYAFLKPEKNGNWFKFDDDKVISVIDKEVLEDNYGGGIAIGTNAYILVYIRESDIDFIQSPVLYKDIPENLQKRLAEEKVLYEQKKKEAEERHLYLTIKIVTLTTFARHQGFDLANFDDQQYPLSDVLQLKVLKSDAYGIFKARVAHHFEISADQVRFWVFANRENKTVRPETPIPDYYHGIVMEEIYMNMTLRQNEVKLFLEVAETWFRKMDVNSHIMIFVKYFNPDTQSLEGLCHLYVQKFGKVGDIIPILCKKKKFPRRTSLKIYEEVKPNMIEEMKPKLTFQQSEIQDGDIICFQKALTKQEVKKHTIAGRIYDVPTFYESLSMRIVVQFKPKHKDREQKPEFDLVLNKKYTYDEVANCVAVYLNTEPLKLRFTTAHPTTGKYKIGIESTTTQTLSEMLQTTHLDS
ncbi:14575_t:CDS:10, partial [Cetraspora pellucida]